MTSMPASRSARAITLAPRSCPSRPTLAMTTRVLRAIGAAVYGRASDRRGLLSRLAEPRRRPVRLPRRGRWPPPAARLRARRARPAAGARRPLAERRRGLDHALAPRPLGRSRPVGVGKYERARPGRRETRALAPAGRARPH